MCYHRTGDAARARACFDRAAALNANAGLDAEETAEMNIYRAEAELALAQ
jgi:hypothetical protein